MNELNKKYLNKLLEGAEQGLEQLDGAVNQLKSQLDQMMEQREEMVTAERELKKLLGVEGDSDEE